MSASCMCGSSACVYVPVYVLSVYIRALPYPVLSRYSLSPSPYNCLLLLYSALLCPLVLHKDIRHRCKRPQSISSISECDIQSIRNRYNFLRYVLVRTVVILLIFVCTALNRLIWKNYGLCFVYSLSDHYVSFVLRLA